MKDKIRLPWVDDITDEPVDEEISEILHNITQSVSDNVFKQGTKFFTEHSPYVVGTFKVQSPRKHVQNPRDTHKHSELEADSPNCNSAVSKSREN